MLFGTGADGEPTALDWARLGDTIDYNLTASVAVVSGGGTDGPGEENAS